MHIVSFETIFHHIFLYGIADIAYHVSIIGQYSLEFETKGTFSLPSIRFWKVVSLKIVRLFRYRTASEPAAGFLMASSRLLPELSAQPQVVSVSGFPAELISLIERSRFFERGLNTSSALTPSHSLPRCMSDGAVSLEPLASSPSLMSHSWTVVEGNLGLPRCKCLSR